MVAHVHLVADLRLRYEMSAIRSDKGEKGEKAGVGECGGGLTQVEDGKLVVG